MSNSRVQLAEVNALHGAAALLFVIGVIGLGYSSYLYFSELHNDYQAKVATAWYLFKPDLLIDLIYVGGYLGTLACVYWVSAHALIITGIAAFTGYQIWSLQNNLKSGEITFSWRPPFLHSNRKDMLDELDRPDIITTAPADSLRSIKLEKIQSVLVHRGRNIDRLFPEYYMRLKRASLKFKRSPENNIEKLEMALIEVLHAHKEWPADPKGHHANTSLYDHSMEVARKLRKMAPDEPLATCIGLAHDIGKLLAYKFITEDDGEEYWKRIAKGQEYLSAQVIRMLEEFWELDQAQRNTLNIVLNYSHSVNRLPKSGVLAKDRAILEKLRIADGITTHQEQHSEIEDDDDLRHAIHEAIGNTLASMNINSWRNHKAEPDGWTLYIMDHVAVSATQLISAFSGNLKPGIAKKLALSAKIKRADHHAATPVIFAVLKDFGWIDTQYEDHIPKFGLFNITHGENQRKYHGVWLFKKDVLEEKIGDNVDSWGSANHKVRILSD